MKSAIEIFATLGERLRDFGNDTPSQQAMQAACAANRWFLPTEIKRAVRSIAEQMLERRKMETWLAAYPVPVARPQRVLVVMAGNIPLVGFFDLLCVVASGHRCLIKPSSKDTAMMRYIVGQLLDIEPHTAVEFYDGTSPVDAVIATGSDNAVRYFQTHYAGLPTLLRGSRQSVAVLSGHETEAQLAGLADDIWAYSGLGCRNVSLVFLPEGCPLSLQMPVVNEKYRNNYRQSRALLEMQQRPFLDFGAATGVEQCAFPLALSCIAYSHYPSADEVTAWLAAHDEQLQCVVSECIAHSRRVDFGQAQAPALTDYADAKDVVAWLAALNQPKRCTE